MATTRFVDATTALTEMAARRRRWTIALRMGLALLLGVMVACVFQAVASLFLLIEPQGVDPEQSAWEVMWGFIYRLPQVGAHLGAFLQQVGLDDFVRDSPRLFFGGLGFFVGAFTLGGRAEKTYARYLAEFDRTRFARIRKPLPYDPLRAPLIADDAERPMRWVKPREGPRGVIWTALHAFADQSSASDCPRVAMFGWTLIMGRPGSGKTRMAVEFARTLGRRDLYGGERAKAKWRDRLRTWWRVQVLRRPCEASDFWDAGWIRPEKMDPVRQDEKRSVSGGWIDAISDWRPRRPTILLFDDPVPGDTVHVVSRLNQMKAAFRHPVRLLIVNQSAPADLRMRVDPETGSWSSEIVTPLVAPIVVSDQAAFTERDIRMIRWDMLSVGARQLSLDPQVQEFLRVTRGNPLLVELGFAWLRTTGRPLDEMTEDALLAARVQRIFEALEAAGFGDEGARAALAAATIAGGSPVDFYTGESSHADRSAAEPAFAERTAIEAALRWKPGSFRALARIFPADAVDLRRFLPPIRPELIGDAFARAVVAELDPSAAARVLAASWRAYGRGTLRTSLRIGGRDDPLGRLLAQAPPPEAGLAAGEFAPIYAEAAALVARSDWDNGHVGVAGKGLLGTAVEVLSRLADDEIEPFLTRLLGLLETPNTTAIIRRPEINALIFETLTLAVERPVFTDVGDLVRAFAAWLERSPSFGGDQGLDFTRLREASGNWMKGYDVEDTASTRARLSDALAAVAISQGDADVRRVLMSTLEGLFDVFGNAGDPIAAEEATLARIAALALSGDSDAAAELATAFEPHASGQRGSSLLSVQAWRYVTSAFCEEAAACRAAAERVDALAVPFAGDRDFELGRARVWRHVGYAFREDAPVCRAVAERVDEIAAPFAGERDFC